MIGHITIVFVVGTTICLSWSQFFSKSV